MLYAIHLNLMRDPILPPWGDDALSTFLADAHRNERVSSLNLPDLYALLRRVHAAFLRAAAITEKEGTDHLLPTRLLMARVHGAWLGAVRLAESGQTFEAYPLVRAVVENAWYALHLAKDPAPPARAEIWLRRREDQAAKRRCKDEFTVANVRATHAELDAATAAVLQDVYERTIELGGHPNEFGVLSVVRRVETERGRTYEPAFLTDSRLLIQVSAKAAVEAAIGALRTFRLIFPERFAIMGLDLEINGLVFELNGVYTRYAAAEPRGSESSPRS
jgi:hypothetical protein